MGKRNVDGYTPQQKKQRLGRFVQRVRGLFRTASNSDSETNSESLFPSTNEDVFVGDAPKFDIPPSFESLLDDILTKLSSADIVNVDGKDHGEQEVKDQVEVSIENITHEGIQNESIVECEVRVGDVQIPEFKPLFTNSVEFINYDGIWSSSTKGIFSHTLTNVEDVQKRILSKLKTHKQCLSMFYEFNKLIVGLCNDMKALLQTYSGSLIDDDDILLYNITLLSSSLLEFHKTNLHIEESLMNNNQALNDLYDQVEDLNNTLISPITRLHLEDIKARPKIEGFLDLIRNEAFNGIYSKEQRLDILSHTVISMNDYVQNINYNNSLVYEYEENYIPEIMQKLEDMEISRLTQLKDSYNRVSYSLKTFGKSVNSIGESMSYQSSLIDVDRGIKLYSKSISATLKHVDRNIHYSLTSTKETLLDLAQDSLGGFRYYRSLDEPIVENSEITFASVILKVIYKLLHAEGELFQSSSNDILAVNLAKDLLNNSELGDTSITVLFGVLKHLLIRIENGLIPVHVFLEMIYCINNNIPEKICRKLILELSESRRSILLQLIELWKKYAQTQDSPYESISVLFTGLLISDTGVSIEFNICVLKTLIEILMTL